jgi:hypothetical protein
MVLKTKEGGGAMNLTERNKAIIDGKSYTQLLSGWRFAPIGSQWFQGETGKYWAKRMNELRAEDGGNERHVSASKAIGWGDK